MPTLPPAVAKHPLRILHLSPAPIWDEGEGEGMPSIFLGLKGFVDAGHRVVFAVAARRSRTYDYHGIEVREWAVPVPVAPIRHRWLHRFTQKLWGLAYYAIATVRGLRLAAEFAPDVVYGQFLYAAPVAWLIGRVREIPNVTRMYGTFLFAYVHSWWGRLWKAEEVLAFVVPCDYLIVTNDGTRGREVAAALGVPSDRVRYWRNGVDKGTYDPAFDRAAFRASLAIPPDHKVVTSISRLADWKRVDRLIAALPAVLEAVPAVTAVVVGDGPERPRLEAMAKELGVANHVRFIGSVLQTEVRKYLNGADVFTSFYDVSNVGNPILEALACGRCVVSLNNGGTGEINEHGEAALLLAPDAPEREIPAALIRVLRDDALRARYEVAARAYADRHLQTRDERVRMEVELIEDLVSRSRPAPTGARPSHTPLLAGTK